MLGYSTLGGKEIIYRLPSIDFMKLYAFLYLL